MGFKLANINGRAVLVAGEHYYDLETVSGGSLGCDPMAALGFLEQLAKVYKELAKQQPTGLFAEANIDAPVPRPANVYAVGLNYRKHAEESGLAIPDVPMVFTKYPSCIVGPNADVELRSDYGDYEAELVVAIGEGGKDISTDDAWNHIAGLCVGQDFSDRAVQFMSGPPQFCMGKSLDTFGPIGPVLVSPDLVDNPGSLALECLVNGQMRQKDTTGDLIFDVPALVAYLSHLVTLKTGDLIFTGTPAGVGAPAAKFLKEGDVVTTTIAGLGSISNRCVRVADHPHADVVPEMIKNIIAKAQGK